MEPVDVGKQLDERECLYEVVAFIRGHVSLLLPSFEALFLTSTNILLHNYRHVNYQTSFFLC